MLAQFVGEKPAKGTGIVRSFRRGNQYSAVSPQVYEKFTFAK